MQIAVAATPEVAIPTLELLLKSPHQLSAVITQPDRPAGRGLSLKESAVGAWAVQNGITLYKPESQDELAQIAGRFDLIITIGYGMIIREEILDLPKFGFINLHFSLLPRWRGAAPVQRAIETGDERSGVTVFKLDKGMDTGPIFRQLSAEIRSDATSASLLKELAVLGAPVVLETIAAIAQGETPKPQEISGATRAVKLTKEEGRIDWSLPAEVIYRKIRAFFPSPGSWTTFRGSIIRVERVSIGPDTAGIPGEIAIAEKMLIVSCGQGSLKIIDVKASGKSTMPASAWLNGAQPKPGESFK